MEGWPRSGRGGLTTYNHTACQNVAKLPRQSLRDCHPFNEGELFNYYEIAAAT
ncbi:MAG: hypothetical protein LBB23_04000 [Rickettsiales bacterium]|nr:hypothetical protein [Rickettsiales bacterium]